LPFGFSLIIINKAAIELSIAIAMIALQLSVRYFASAVLVD
jgi:hypothetical protein